jgi:hypothetical protein
MVKLRKFDKDDWLGFAGREAKTPLIGNVTLLISDKKGDKKIEGTVIVDKDDISLFFGEFDNDNNDDLPLIFSLSVPMMLGKFIVEHMNDMFEKEYLEGLTFICEDENY